MKRVVIAGTGTDVGKTFVATGLLKALGKQSIKVIGLKPVESGFGEEWTSDAGALYAASGAPSSVDWRPRYALKAPVSPHLAARQEGVEIELSHISNWCESNMERADDSQIVLMETAGGLFSPLSTLTTNLDLVRQLEPCLWLLVAPNRLGVLHDVGATVRAASAEHRSPDVLYLNQITQDDSTASNAAELRRMHPKLTVTDNLSALVELICRRDVLPCG